VGDKKHQRREGHTELFELATRQHGVVSTRQLNELGYGRSSAAKAHRVGRLRRIHRGVYAVGHEALDWHGRCMAAVLAAQPAVASHLSAAYLWGLLRYRPETIHATAPTHRRQRRGFRIHYAVLETVDLTAIERTPVTSLARTYLDLAAMLSEARLERELERSEELKIFDLRDLEAVLDRYAGHPGAGRLGRALAIYRPDAAVTRSGLERRFLRLVRAAGLSSPSMNFHVAGFELDAYWEPERFAVELDVYETHGTRAAFERDRLRHEDLKLAGIEMIRVTGPRLDREPNEVVGRVAVLLERRRREFGLPLRLRRGGAR
jgi:very-short-patch-repair endonuclease